MIASHDRLPSHDGLPASCAAPAASCRTRDPRRPGAHSPDCPGPEPGGDATAGATGTNPPAKATNLQASAEHDSVTLTWTASTDQTVTHYALLRRNRDIDASGVFHVIESNAGPGTGHDDNSVQMKHRKRLSVLALFSVPALVALNRLGNKPRNCPRQNLYMLCNIQDQERVLYRKVGEPR